MILDLRITGIADFKNFKGCHVNLRKYVYEGQTVYSEKYLS